MKNLHDIIQKNMESFDEQFVEMHPMLGRDSHNPPTLHYTDLEKVEEIKFHLLSSQLSIIQAIDEWAENEHEHKCTGEDCDCIEYEKGYGCALSELRSFLKEAKNKLQ